MKKEYYIINLLYEWKRYGPFNTCERAQAFMKKHHIYGQIIDKDKEEKK